MTTTLLSKFPTCFLFFDFNKICFRKKKKQKKKDKEEEDIREQNELRAKLGLKPLR